MLRVSQPAEGRPSPPPTRQGGAGRSFLRSEARDSTENPIKAPSGTSPVGFTSNAFRGLAMQGHQKASQYRSPGRPQTSSSRPRPVRAGAGRFFLSNAARNSTENSIRVLQEQAQWALFLNTGNVEPPESKSISETRPSKDWLFPPPTRSGRGQGEFF